MQGFPYYKRVPSVRIPTPAKEGGGYFMKGMVRLESTKRRLPPSKKKTGGAYFIRGMVGRGGGYFIKGRRLYYTILYYNILL